MSQQQQQAPQQAQETTALLRLSSSASQQQDGGGAPGGSSTYGVFTADGPPRGSFLGASTNTSGGGGSLTSTITHHHYYPAPPGTSTTSYSSLWMLGIMLIISMLFTGAAVFLGDDYLRMKYGSSSTSISTNQISDTTDGNDFSSITMNSRNPATTGPGRVSSSFRPSDTTGTASKKNVGDTTSSSSTSQSYQYTSTQFISFTINTLGGLAKHGECIGRPVDTNGVCYLGNPTNLTEDLYHRVALIQEVLTRIRKDRFRDHPRIDHSSTVLKIVLLPEFFLRGPYGAYTLGNIFEDKILVDVADDIKSIISHDDFHSYLFGFGTVIATTANHTQLIMSMNSTTTSNSAATDIDYYNFAPIYRGGNHSEYYLVVKKYISTADFLDRTTLPNPATVKREYSPIPKQFRDLVKSRSTKLIENNVLHIDGLTIGIEICLDHRLGVLWDSLQQTYHTDVRNHLVDILLITSAGMAIERGPNPIVPGGVVYMSDGEASSGVCRRGLATTHDVYDPDKVCREDIAGRKHIPQGGPGYSDFVPLVSCLDVENSDLLRGYYSLYQTQGCAYTLKLFGVNIMKKFLYYAPSIEVYPTIDLPGRN